MSEVEAETAADRTGAARDAQWPRPTVAGPPTNPEAVRTDSINIGKENRLGLWSPFRQRHLHIRRIVRDRLQFKFNGDLSLCLLATARGTRCPDPDLPIFLRNRFLIFQKLQDFAEVWYLGGRANASRQRPQPEALRQADRYKATYRDFTPVQQPRGRKAHASWLPLHLPTATTPPCAL